MRLTPFPLRCLLVLLALASSPVASAQPFTDLVDFPRSEANWDRFYALEAHLANRFDAACADTLCEGEYSNLRALQLRCSVREAGASVQACTWIFIASNLDVDPEQGGLIADNRRWECPLPLGAGVPVETFHAALAGPDALGVTLPGASVSVGAAIGRCLQQGASDRPARAVAGRYVDARDFPGPGQGQPRFTVLERDLTLGFDNICGDTFCEGEYYNLQALRLRCSVDAHRGLLQACAWTFAGSNAWVDTASGAIQVDGADWTCRLPLAPHTPLTLLLDTLQGRDAIDIPLPGSSSTVYEGLTACL